MPGDWRNSVSEELPAFGLGNLGEDSEPLTVTFQGDGEMVDTKNGEAYRAPVVVEDCPDNYEAMGDNGFVSEGTEYYVMSSSSRFLSGLIDLETDDLTDHTVTITVSGSGFNRDYSVTPE